MCEDAGGEDRVIAVEDAGDVLHRFAGVEPDLVAACVDGMPTELSDGDLHRLACAGGGLVEDQRHARSGERTPERLDRSLGELEHGAELLDSDVGDVEERARPGHGATSASTPATMPAASS